MIHIPKKHQSICSNFGVFGILIAATCLIQQMIFSAGTWLSFTLAGIYLFAISAFLMLALQKTASPVILIVSTVLSLCAQAILTITLAISPVVMILFIYSLVAVVVVYMEEVPKKLREKALAVKMDELAWRDRI